jgi:hypothetical protein
MQCVGKWLVTIQMINKENHMSLTNINEKNIVYTKN